MEISIGNRKIGPGHPCFIIAEMSANHLQNFDLAVKIIREAAKCGADAIKLQTFTPDTLTIDCDRDCFTISQGTVWDGRTLYDLYSEACSPWEWQPELKKIAEEEGLVCFSTPYDQTAVEFLEKMNVPAYKVASFEILDVPLIECVASKNKPVIISTGISTISEIAEAVATCRNAGNNDIILLKCTSAYPAPPDEINLKTIKNLAETFGVIAGLSDHTAGISVPVGAVALGACVIEKHFTLSRDNGGPDAGFSLEPDEFNRMVKSIREVEKAIGSVTYELSATSKRNRAFARSLFAVRDIPAGETLSSQNIRSIRPGFGLPPKYLKQLIGKKSSKMILRGTPLSWDMVERSE
ncbi:MAG: pseudaminic acid synthase [Methanoregula sp.]|nr:pseudaminic acid synthase [Methanoregula sp.]